jgi:polyisoprenoid-binding protein YceI
MKSYWTIDLAHSSLSFTIKYLNISVVTGFLKSFRLNLQTSGDGFGEVTNLVLTADIASVTTNHEERDKQLRSMEFFDAENHLYLKFEGVSFEKQGLDPPSILSVYRKDYKLRGNLTIKGICRPVILDGEFGGLATDTTGQKRAGFTLRGKISRKEFGLTWNGMTDSGKLILSDQVNIIGNLQLIKID